MKEPTQRHLSIQHILLRGINLLVDFSYSLIHTLQFKRQVCVIPIPLNYWPLVRVQIYHISVPLNPNGQLLLPPLALRGNFILK